MKEAKPGKRRRLPPGIVLKSNDTGKSKARTPVQWRYHTSTFTTRISRPICRDYPSTHALRSPPFTPHALPLPKWELRCPLLDLTDNLTGPRQRLDHLLALLSPSNGVVALLEELFEFIGSVHVLEQLSLHFVFRVSNISH